MRRQVEENDGTLLVRLPSGLKRRLEGLAEERKVSVSEAVRAAIRGLLESRYGVVISREEEEE